MPTGMLIYTSMALMLNSEALDTPVEENETKNNNVLIPVLNNKTK
jgi:hypothetical protein